MPSTFRCPHCGAKWTFYQAAGKGANFNKGMFTQHKTACEKRTPDQRRKAAERMWKAEINSDHPGMVD